MGLVQEPLIYRESLREKIFDVLKRWILEGTLKPGQKIIESTLANRLQVSRAPLREALFLLAQRGLVTIRPHRGTYVTRLSETEIREIFEIREILEMHAARKFRATLTPEKAEELKGALNQMREATRARDIVAFNEADFGFHRTLWILAGNQNIVDVLVNLSTRFFGYEQIRDMANSLKFLYDSVYKDHVRMLQVILNGSDEELAEEFRESFHKFLNYVLARFARQEQPSE